MRTSAIHLELPGEVDEELIDCMQDDFYNYAVQMEYQHVRAHFELLRVPKLWKLFEDVYVPGGGSFNPSGPAGRTSWRRVAVNEFKPCLPQLRTCWPYS